MSRRSALLVNASRLARYAWASPCSAFGLVLAAIAWAAGGTMRVRAGIIEVAVSGDTAACRGGFQAITFGHVVLGRNPLALSRSRSHEREHVRQYECWGLLFFLLYPASSLLQLMRGRDPYWSNYFEVQARARCGQIHVNLQPDAFIEPRRDA